MKCFWMLLCLSICIPAVSADLCYDAREGLKRAHQAQLDNFVESLTVEGEAREAEKAWARARSIEDWAIANCQRVFADPASTLKQKQEAAEASTSAILNRLAAETKMLRCQLRVLHLKQEMQLIRQSIADLTAYLVAHCGGD